jgi:signal transduction histidine kinase/DNA-binding response OmpR family regulator
MTKKVLEEIKKLVQAIKNNPENLDSTHFELLHNSFEDLEKANEVELLLLIYRILHDYYNHHNEIENHEKLCYQFMPLMIKIKDYMNLGRIYLELSIIKRVKGEYEASLEYIQKSIHTYEQAKNYERVSIALNSLANIYLEKGQYSLALENYHKSFELIQNEKRTDFYYLVKHNLARIYIILNFYDKALELYKQDYDTVMAEKNYERCGAIFQGVAEIYTEENRLMLAYKYAKRSIEFWEKSTNLRGKASAYTTYGSILSKYKKYDEAIKYFNISIDICESFPYKRGLIQSYGELGATLYEMDDYKGAIENLVKARDMAKIINLNFELKKIYSTLYIAFEKNNQKEESYETMKELIILNETYFNLNIQAKVNEVQVNFEMEKKEIEYNKEREVADYKNNLFTYLTHEFRTPLTLIKTPLELIRMETEDESIKQRVDLIESQMENLQKLLGQLLEINQLQEGKMPINKKAGGLLPVLWHIIRDFEKEMKLKKINFIHKIPKKDNQLFFDEDKVEKIIKNLLSNSLKYTQEFGSIFLEVSVYEEKLKIKVNDNGIGIPKKYHKDIFTKFYRIPTSENVTGSGLGLSFVKELVDLMDGEISLDSNKKTGTTFEVKIPIERFDKVLKVKENEDDVETGSKKMNLLIVEDNFEVLKLLKDIFKETYKIHFATNGKEALTQIKKTYPDLIISDVMMPIMNGIELCAQLKNDEKHSHIPIILLSAKSQIHDKIEGLESGADAYIAKPFSLMEIRKTVDSLIQQRKKIIYKYSKNSLQFSEEELVSQDMMIIQSATEFVLEHIENENLSVVDLSNHLNMSRFTLIRRFKGINNMTPNNFIQKIRLEKAKELLKNKVASVSEIAYKVGFASTTYFTSSFKKEFNVTPKEYYNGKD